MDEFKPQKPDRVFPPIPEKVSEEDKKNIEKIRARKAGRPSQEFSAMMHAAARVLKDCGLTYAQIAKQLNVTIKDAKKLCVERKRIDPAQLEKVKQEFAGDMAAVAMSLLERAVDPEFAHELNAKDVISGVGSLIEKIQLLTNKPTSITESRNAAEEAMKKLSELDELEQALKKKTIVPETPKQN